MKALLNGKEVEGDEIDPEFHKFIGMFRAPFTMYQGGGIIACECGQHLKCHGEDFTHWKQGCFDIPQYIFIWMKEGK